MPSSEFVSARFSARRRTTSPSSKPTYLDCRSVLKNSIMFSLFHERSRCRVATNAFGAANLSGGRICLLRLRAVDSESRAKSDPSRLLGAQSVRRAACRERSVARRFPAFRARPAARRPRPRRVVPQAALQKPIRIAQRRRRRRRPFCERLRCAVLVTASSRQLLRMGKVRGGSRICSENKTAPICSGPSDALVYE